MTGSYISQSTAHFNSFNVSSSFQLKDSFNVLSDPVIRFEGAEKNVTNELVLITPAGVFYKKYLVFGSQKEIPLSSVNVVDSAKAKILLGLGIFFILPSLFFWSIIFSIVYFSVIILITYILLLLITGLFRMGIGLGKLLKTSIYASTIFIMIQLLLMPFFRMFLLPLLVYWILLIIILFLWHDQHKGEHSNDNSRDDAERHSSKSKDIFGTKSGSSNSSSNKIEARDSYDVDEHGNMKGSSKKHKHSSDEDDGYVELK